MDMSYILAAGDAHQAAQDVIDEAETIIETVEGFIPRMINFGVNVLIALVLFFLGRVVIRITIKMMNNIMERSRVDESIQKFLSSLVNVTLYILLGIIICGRVGIETTSIIAIFTSASLAIGLALQGALSNLAGGVMILIIKPFKTGDYVVAKTVEGKVERIDLFYTRIITLDNKLVLVPNGELTSSVITNVTAFEKRRVDVKVSISYPDDIEKARTAILAVIGANQKILPDDPIQVVVDELGANGVELKVWVWTATEDYWDVLFALREDIKKALDENGIVIPYNQVDVHIVEEK